MAEELSSCAAESAEYAAVHAACVKELTDLLAEAKEVSRIRRERERDGIPAAKPELLPVVAELRARLAPLAAMHKQTGEERGCSILYTMLLQEWSEVASVTGRGVRAIRREFGIAGMRADFFVEHTDGSVTIIEVKDGSTRALVAAGIGQVLVYQAALERTSGLSPIYPALAVLHKRDQDISRACELAGVEYLPLGSASFWRAISEYVNLVESV